MNKYVIVGFVVATLMFVVAPATFNQGCQVPSTDAPHVVADGSPGNETLNGTASHCLVYGKYCLGDALRGQ